MTSRFTFEQSALAATLGALLLSPLAPTSAVGAQKDPRVAIHASRGNLDVTGWDRDTVEAIATIDGKAQTLQVLGPETAVGAGGYIVVADSLRGSNVTIAVHVPRRASVEATSLGSGSITASDVGAVVFRTGSGDVHVTKAARAQIKTGSGDVGVTDVPGGADIEAGSGDLVAAHTGTIRASLGSGDARVSAVFADVEVDARSGAIDVRGVKGACRLNSLSGVIVVDDVTGAVEANAVSGVVTVTNAGGDVRAFSVSDGVRVRCVGGNVEASSASGDVVLEGVGGDVDANATSGDVRLTAPLRANGRYRLKTLSGDAIFSVVGEPAGFSATLTSFSGDVGSVFPLTGGREASRGATNKRITGRYGDGSVQVTITSFSGDARVSRAAAAPPCGR